jgi:hypothetical protein
MGTTRNQRETQVPKRGLQQESSAPIRRIPVNWVETKLRFALLANSGSHSPIAPRKAKAAYSSVLCAYIAHHKTAAVQEVLFANPREAKEVAVVERLMRFRPHEALIALAKEAEKQSAYAVLESQARLFVARLRH